VRWVVGLAVWGVGLGCEGLRVWGVGVWGCGGVGVWVLGFGVGLRVWGSGVEGVVGVGWVFQVGFWGMGLGWEDVIDTWGCRGVGFDRVVVRIWGAARGRL